MRSYQKFGVIIFTQLLCTTLLAQSMSEYDFKSMKDRSTIMAFQLKSLYFKNHEESLLNKKNLASILNFDHISSCKNSSEKCEFSITNVKSNPKPIDNLTNSSFGISTPFNTDKTSSNLLPTFKNKEIVNNTFNAGIRRVILPKCNGTSTGSVKAKASGGTKPYQFLWSNGSTSKELLGVPAGTYTVTISDAVGNIVVDMTTLTEPAPLQLEVFSNSPTCSSNNDGTVLFHPSGGTPFPYKKSIYTTLWSNSTSNGIMFDISTNTKIDLSSISLHLPGTHLQTISIFIKSGTMVGAEFDSTQWQLISNTQIYGAGRDEVSPIQILNGYVLEPGVYSMYIYNHDGNINGFLSTTIGQAFNYDHILTVFEGISRDSSTNPFLSSIGAGINMAGKITYVVKNDQGFAYKNSYSDGQWFQKQLSSGQHQISMHDALGCKLSKPFTIPVADSIKILSEIIKSPRCYNTNDGEIKIVAQPANSNYHSMTSIPFAHPAYGSMIHLNTTKSVLLKGLDLFLNKSGSVSVFIKSGNFAGSENNANAWTSHGSYSLSKSNSSSGTQLLLNTPTSLTPGDWSIYIYSTDNLFNQLDSIAFYDNYSISYLNSSVRYGSSSAFATTPKIGSYWAGNIIYVDANPNLQYNWSNQSNLPHLTQIAGGNYQCTVLQNNGCSITKNYSIQAPAPVLAKETIIPEVDYDQNGSASLQISGGTPPYYIQWLNTGHIGNHINQLPEGEQPYFVADANGCTLNDTLYILRTLSPSLSEGFLTIGPNPSYGHIRITKEVNGMENCDLSIFDFAGRLILKSATKISTLMQKGLDMSHYADGNYIIMVRDEDQVFQAKANVTR